MDINFDELLKAKKCDCGKTHSCDIKKVIIKEGAINELSENLGDYKNILLVADENTYKAAGEAVKEQIGSRCENVLVYHRDGVVVPNEEAVEKAEKLLTPDTDLIIGVGSGVIQDLCKYVSFNAKLPYYIVATAPSMDGYASVGAAMIMKHMKITYSAHVPEVIIGDVDVLKNAPMDMIKSGYGDILGKYSCLNDWELSHVVNDEYLCEYVYNLTYEMLLKTKDLGASLLQRDAEAIKTLTEALVGVGVAMAYMGNSRPASGSEHHMSHFFEITGILNDEPYFMHGIDVAYSAVYTEKMREEILRSPSPLQFGKFNRAEWENDIREIYTGAAEGVLALQNKLGWYESFDELKYTKREEEIRKTLAKAPSSEEMLSYLKSVELDISEFEKMYGTEKIADAEKYAKDLKDRYTVLWMYYFLKK